jgi:hypothetical protein
VALCRISRKQTITALIMWSSLAFVASTIALYLCYMIEARFSYHGLGMGAGILVYASLLYHMCSFLVAVFIVVVYKIIKMDRFS